MRDLACRHVTGIHSAIVHAVSVCGFILTDANVDQFSDADIDQWEAAIDEWFAEHPDQDPADLG